MAEYIERDAAYALSKIICDAIRNREYHPANFGRFILYRIDDIPAADVMPVRHGRWIKTVGENGVTSACRCSLCGFEDNRYSLFNYCPNCGAKMDGEAEENDVIEPSDDELEMGFDPYLGCYTEDC